MRVKGIARHSYYGAITPSPTPRHNIKIVFKTYYFYLSLNTLSLMIVNVTESKTDVRNATVTIASAYAVSISNSVHCSGNATH